MYDQLTVYEGGSLLALLDLCLEEDKYDVAEMYIEHPHYFDMYFVVSRENLQFFLDFASLIVLYLFFWFCRSLISYKSSAISTNILEASYLIAGVGAEGRAQDCGWRRRSCYPRSLSFDPRFQNIWSFQTILSKNLEIIDILIREIIALQG